MGKFIFIQLLCALFCVDLSAQILYSNTFDNDLNGMKVVDMDGNSPHINVSEFSGTWSSLSDRRFEQYSSGAAVSGSFYSPSGTSDDWLITPKINIPVGALLTWDAMSLDDDFQDSYEVRVSTTGDDPADFTEILFKVDKQESELTTRSVVLNEYAGQEIYIAFRNISNDKFLLIIDNIFVRIPYERDVFIKSLDLGVNYVEAQDVNITLAETKNLKARLLNFGSKRIQNLVVSYTLNGQKIEETITGNLDSGEDMIFESNAIDIPVGNGQIMDLDIVSINGQSDQDAQNNKLSVNYDGMPATPGYVSNDSKGRNVNTFNLTSQGKTIVYYFFTSDCDDCEDAVNKLNQYYLSQGAGNDGLEVIGITLNPQDDNTVLNNLGWSVTFPMMEYLPYNERLYVHFAQNHGLSTEENLPFVVQVCPNQENPAFSTIISSYEGFDNQDIFNEVFRPDHDSCQETVSSVENIDLIDNVALYPNPSGNQDVTLSIQANSTAPINVELLDMTGRVVHNYGVKILSTGDNNMVLNIENIAMGTYMVRIQKENQVNTLKLSIIK